MVRILRYHLALYYLNAFEQRRKALQGLARCTHALPLYSPAHNRFSAATSITPEGLVALLLASAGNFILPILLSAAQLEASRRWPDSDIPRNIEQIKVIVNIAGAAATSIVAALKQWRASRMAAVGAVAEVLRDVEAVEADETTALRSGQKQPTYSKSPARHVEVERTRVTFDAELLDLDMKEDQAQMATVLPVS